METTVALVIVTLILLLFVGVVAIAIDRFFLVKVKKRIDNCLGLFLNHGKGLL